MHVMISCGDINGIATDIFFRTFSQHVFPDMQFSIAINEDTCLELCKKWNITYSEQSLHFGKVLISVLPCTQYAQYRPGTSQSDAATLAIESLEIALDSVTHGKADALLTLPIAKDALNAEGWKLVSSEFAGVNAQVVYDNPNEVELPKGNIIINNK